MRAVVISLELVVLGVLGLGLLGLTLGCATSPKQQEIARLRLTIGTAYLTQGKYRMALAELLEAQKADPDNAAVQNNIGLTYFFLNDLTDAKSHLEQAVAMSADYTEAKNNLARIDISLALYNEAEELAQKVLKDLTYPTPEKAWINLGLVSFHRGQYRQAAERFGQAINLDHKNCLAFDYYGRSFYELNRYADSARVLDQAINFCKDGKFDEPQYYSALSYYRLGQREKALARLDNIISEYPDGKYLARAQKMKKLIQ